MSGALAGLRVVELSHELTAWAGKLLADLGAEVIVVEPPGGSRQRTWGPFLDDRPGLERSLWWWHYNTSKYGVVLDLADPHDSSLLRALVGTADVLLAAEPLQRQEWCADGDRLVTVSVTGPEPLTDLTLLAEGGPVWSCGYDDHSLPPVRGGGNQGFHTAAHWATIGTLVALLERETSGSGQHVDVSALAAANVTTEIGSYGWLICGVEVSRQTGRHAMWFPTLPTQLRCADGHYVNSGTTPRRGAEFQQMIDWLDDIGLREQFDGTVFLEMGAQHGVVTAADLADPVMQQIMQSVREAQQFVAARLSAYEFFVSAQRRGLPAGIIYAPEELFTDEHFVARGWPVEVEHSELGRSFTYPGQPYAMTGTPWRIRRRAPLLGEDQAILHPLASASPDATSIP